VTDKIDLPPTRNTSTSEMDRRNPPSITFDEATREIERRSGDDGLTIQSDPAFGPLGDPLKSGDTKATAKVVTRSIPLVVVQNSWSVAGARNALASHSNGVFEKSGQLAISIRGDPRVTATLGSLRAGYFGREVRFKAAQGKAKGSAAAKEVFDAWVDHWPQFETGSDFGQMSDYERLMGFADAQLLWDTTGDNWLPYMRYWFARYSYWNWDIRKLVAITQDGTRAIIPGNGRWVHHSRFGLERCWDFAALRPIAEPYLMRHWAARDWARWSEKHGIPTEIAETPMAADPVERTQFVDAIANRGSETAILLGKGVDKDNSYDFRLVEATDDAWQGFQGLRSSSDQDIVLALMFQSMTTEQTEGALKSEIAAGMDIREAGIQDDDKAWQNTIHRDVARPFAFFNFGDPDLAPWTNRDVVSRQQYANNAKNFQAFGTALQAASAGGVKFKDPKQVQAWAAKAFGLDEMPDLEISDPPAGDGAGNGEGAPSFGAGPKPPSPVAPPKSARPPRGPKPPKGP
jgi:hypothetical protein